MNKPSLDQFCGWLNPGDKYVTQNWDGTQSVITIEDRINTWIDSHVMMSRSHPQSIMTIRYNDGLRHRVTLSYLFSITIGKIIKSEKLYVSFPDTISVPNAELVRYK